MAGSSDPGSLARDGVVDRPSDAALWRAVVHALRALVDVPDGAAPDGTDRRRLAHLLALAEHASSRGTDPGAARRAELRGLLGGPAVAPDAARSITEVVLDGDDPRRDVIRAALVAHVDQDLASEEGLLAVFPAPGNRVADEPPDGDGGP